MKRKNNKQKQSSTNTRPKGAEWHLCLPTCALFPCANIFLATRPTRQPREERLKRFLAKLQECQKYREKENPQVSCEIFRHAFWNDVKKDVKAYFVRKSNKLKGRQHFQRHTKVHAELPNLLANSFLLIFSLDTILYLHFIFSHIYEHQSVNQCANFKSNAQTKY
jgi:hypothetical protein